MTAQSLSFPVPSSLGSLENYIQAVNRFPILSAEEELELARRFHQQQDLEAARQLVLSHLRLVVSIARGYLGYGLPHADLIQEGNVGLMKAVKRYDPERGVRLVSFAVHWIKAEIHEYILKNWRLLKVATTKAQRKLFFNLRSLKQHEGSLSPDEVESMAQTLKVSPDDVREMETRLYGQDVSLEASSDDEDSHAFAPIAYLAAPDAEPIADIERKEREHLATTGLAQALDSLDERSRRIIQARWLNEEDPATLHELAAEYGISAERVRQIEAKALQKMRAALSH
ncbi:RNA polymerase RpoH-like sigma 32 subunit [Sulfuritortus calidifontis]|uniref:RNA polymerase sigma factor RpoH n=1 Tax=Sulfuritortus calidifontis TaxID=1914471 RepID=A0A4R3JZZ0_9PROT|nr:RNA polymerase sigma factor RpoH [Sulfuritortus calidifontis]TCS73470.1 RNA polymerase RpoH-like sigma 32 subunit [Sulfuritortus calidifontis]